MTVGGGPVGVRTRPPIRYISPPRVTLGQGWVAASSRPRGLWLGYALDILMIILNTFLYVSASISFGYWKSLLRSILIWLTGPRAQKYNNNSSHRREKHFFIRLIAVSIMYSTLHNKVVIYIDVCLFGASIDISYCPVNNHKKFRSVHSHSRLKSSSRNSENRERLIIHKHAFADLRTSNIITKHWASRFIGINDDHILVLCVWCV